MNFRRLVYCLLFATVWQPLACSKPIADSEMKANVKRQAEAIGADMAVSDFNKLAEFTFPPLLKKIGGRDRLIQTVQRGMNEGKFAFKDVRIGEPEQLTTVGSRRFIILPQTIELLVDVGTLTTQSFLLGISDDGGRNWSFIDGAGMSNPGLKEILPDLPASLKFPVKPPDRITPNR